MLVFNKLDIYNQYMANNSKLADKRFAFLSICMQITQYLRISTCLAFEPEVEEVTFSHISTQCYDSVTFD